MLRAGACKRALRTLGTGVLAVFLFGSTSGPLRACLSHPGHASGAPVAELTPPHHATSSTHSSAPATDHGGCTCLGRCSLEHAPYLPGAHLPSVTRVPPAPKTLDATSRWVRVVQNQFDLPLARPPPAVV